MIFGIWNSHTSLGNILGTTIAAQYVETDWGLSFIVPGAIMGICGFIIFLFLVPHPENIGYSTPGPIAYRKIDTPGSSDESSGGDEEARNSDEVCPYIITVSSNLWMIQFHIIVNFDETINFIRKLQRINNKEINLLDSSVANF